MMRLGTLKIDRRFRGPPRSGNGGYVCGRLARFVEGAARVRLHMPPPLEIELAIERTEDGVRLFDGERAVATAWPTEIDIALPEAPGFAEATDAAQRFIGFDDHYYPSCFVCGPHREPGDGLRIFPGPVEGREIFACPWVPDASLGDDAALVAPEFVWAVLDCPGGFVFPRPAEGTILLGELAVALSHPVAVGEECVVVAWERAHAGRKHHTATALFGHDGGCRGVALGTWLEVPL